MQVNVCTRGAFYSSHVHTSCGHMWTMNYVHTTHLQVNSDHGFVQEPPVKTVMDAWRRRSWMLYCQALPAKSCTWEVRCKAWKRLLCLYNKVNSSRSISVENWGYLKNRISPIWAENPELDWSLPLGSYFRLRSPKTDCVQVTVSSQRLPLQENIW